MHTSRYSIEKSQNEHKNSYKNDVMALFASPDCENSLQIEFIPFERTAKDY